MAKHRSTIRRDERRRNRSKKTSRLNPNRPRLVVFRSLKHFEAQIVNDFDGHTLTAVSSRDKALAKKAKSAKVGPVVLDRNGYPYHGRVKAFAEAARKGGLEF